MPRGQVTRTLRLNSIKLMIEPQGFAKRNGNTQRRAKQFWK